MTREELLNLVNKEVDTTKFTSLSQKTINEELDDVLEDFGDDEEANSKIVTKLANRLKRMDGNLHKNVSDEMKKNRAEAERRRRRKTSARSRERETKTTVIRHWKISSTSSLPPTKSETSAQQSRPPLTP